MKARKGLKKCKQVCDLFKEALGHWWLEGVVCVCRGGG